MYSGVLEPRTLPLLRRRHPTLSPILNYILNMLQTMVCFPRILVAVDRLAAIPEGHRRKLRVRRSQQGPSGTTSSPPPGIEAFPCPLQALRQISKSLLDCRFPTRCTRHYSSSHGSYVGSSVRSFVWRWAIHTLAGKTVRFYFRLKTNVFKYHPLLLVYSCIRWFSHVAGRTIQKLLMKSFDWDRILTSEEP